MRIRIFSIDFRIDSCVDITGRESGSGQFRRSMHPFVLSMWFCVLCTILWAGLLHDTGDANKVEKVGKGDGCAWVQ